MSEKKSCRLRLIRADELAKMRSDLTAKVVKNGIKYPDTERQTDFAHKIVSEDIKVFLNHFDSFPKGTDDIEVSFPESDAKMTESEYSGPPLESEKRLYSRLKDIPPRVAAAPAFWTSYQVEMVRRGIILPGFFAANSGVSQTGRARLESALKRNNSRELDACVRTVLRRLGGLPEVRGNVSLFVDCRVARSWWRGYIANSVAEDCDYDCESIWKLLRLTTAPWDSMMLYGLKRLTIISDRAVRSAFIARLAEMQIPDKTKHRKELIETWMRQIGELSAGRDLGYLSVDENTSLFEHKLVK